MLTPMNRIFYFPAMVFACLVLSAFQTPQQRRGTYTQAQIEQFIQEVYQDQAQAMAAAGSARRQDFEAFLSRVRVEAHPELKGKKFKLLASVPLVVKYNPSLAVPKIFSEATFNPLAYRFDMFAQHRQTYRADQSDYLIIIDPVNQP